MQLKKYVAGKAQFIDSHLTDKDKAFLATANGQSYNPTNQAVTAEAVKMLLKLDAVKLDNDLVIILENRQRLSRSSVKSIMQ